MRDPRWENNLTDAQRGFKSFQALGAMPALAETQSEAEPALKLNGETTSSKWIDGTEGKILIICAPGAAAALRQDEWTCCWLARKTLGNNSSISIPPAPGRWGRIGLNSRGIWGRASAFPMQRRRGWKGWELAQRHFTPGFHFPASVESSEECVCAQGWPWMPGLFPGSNDLVASQAKCLSFWILGRVNPRRFVWNERFPKGNGTGKTQQFALSEQTDFFPSFIIILKTDVTIMLILPSNITAAWFISVNFEDELDFKKNNSQV